MADNQGMTYTLADLRLAFDRGARFACDIVGRSVAACAVSQEAKRRYPSPKKLREVVMNSLRYRVNDGVVEVTSDNHWVPSSFSHARIRTLSDLLANPYEDDNS